MGVYLEILPNFQRNEIEVFIGLNLVPVYLLKIVIGWR
jgi:hypothetical protein